MSEREGMAEAVDRVAHADPPSARAQADLSIVIVSWNVLDRLRPCLDSIQASGNSIGLEVIVVDNASSDGTAVAVRFHYPWVRLFANDVNAGFARGNNQGLRETNGRYVLLLNPDTEARSGALEALVAFMDAHPGAGGCGPRLLNPDGSLQVSCYPFPTLGREFWRLFHLDRFRKLGIYPMERWDRSSPREVDDVQGACLLLRSEALAEVGLLDEDYFIYTEEVDLCYRLRAAGWGLYWVPGAEVVHYGGQSTRQVQAEMFLHLYRSKVQFFRKQYGAASARAYKAVLLVATLARLALSPAAWLGSRARRERNLRLAGNYYRLLLNLPSL